MSRHPIVRVVAFLLAVSWADTDALGQTADDLFDRNVVHEVRLYVHTRDLHTLRERAFENTYYPADVNWRDTRVRNVAVRSRGNGSRSATKLGLRLEFDRYIGGQRLAGLSSLVLDNHTQDPSLLHERLAFALLERMGVPVPRSAFAKVYINDEYEGLYSMVEEPNAEFAARVVGEPGGYLFEYRWLRPYSFEDLGDDLTNYAPLFEPRTHERAPASELYAPIREMMRTGIDSDLHTWRTRVERYLGLSDFVTLAAVEAFLSETDGVTGVDGANNFYLARAATSSRHVMVPWDRDQAFSDVDRTIFPAVGNHVLRSALEFPDLRQLYLTRLADAARIAEDNGWLEREARAAAALVAAPGAADYRQPFSATEHETAVASLVTFARTRSAQVRAELARPVPEGWPSQ